MAALLTLIASCTQKTCHIEGIAEGKNDGDTLMLITDMENGVPRDTIFVSGGHFEADVPIDSVCLCILRVADSTGVIQPFFLEPGTVKLDIKKDAMRSTVGGTPLNDEWQKLNAAALSFSEKMAQLQSQMSEDPSESDKQQFLEKLHAEQGQLAQLYYEVAERNISNELGFVLTTNPELLSEEQVLRLFNMMPPKMHARKEVQEIERYLKHTGNADMGQDPKLQDFSAKDPNGKTVSAMDVVSKSKLTIIDFWASWCQPCMQEMPHMVQIYQLYHPKGLDILGVSLDNDGDAWRKAIEQTGAKWTQISELTRDSKIAAMFGVRAIPFTIIVDQEGNVLASGLVGNALEDFVRNQLSED